MTIGNRVLKILKEKGLKQNDLAAQIGTKPSTVNGWHEENRNPSSTSIIPICEFLGVSVGYLLTGRDDPQSIPDDPLLEKIISIYKEMSSDQRNQLAGFAQGLVAGTPGNDPSSNGAGDEKRASLTVAAQRKAQ